MQLGMLWLDTDKKRSLEEKVERAAEYYKDKYGRLPELCLVHANMLSQEKKIGRIKIQPTNAIVHNHFWLGSA
ncbi:MAG: hypothetical protein KDE48_06220 [Anaerolineales bacterium]|nr:hypothetical protein [Anaerolineales bacterium]